MFRAKHREASGTTDATLALRAWGRLIRVAQKVGRSGTERLREQGLTPVQFDVLRRVAARPDQTQQDLAEGLDVTRGNVSQLLSRLEADGLIVRVPSGGSNLLRLTSAGRATVERLLPEHDRFVAERFSALTTDELRQLLTLLEKLDHDER